MYNDMGMTSITRIKVIYENIFSVPIIQNASKSYRVFSVGKVEMHYLSLVRAKFRCGVGLGQ